MKKIIFILTCLSTLGGHLAAQNPKWFKKAAKAQISIVTMNAVSYTHLTLPTIRLV